MQDFHLQYFSLVFHSHILRNKNAYQAPIQQFSSLAINLFVIQ